MFRLIMQYPGDQPEVLDPNVFETEAAAEEAAKPYLEAGAAVSARILRPLAELAPVTTIQRRPVNG